MATSKKGKKVTPREAAKMLALYKELGSYAAVAKKCRRSANCVAAHIKPLLAFESGLHTI